MSIAVDTNVLVDLLAGDTAAAAAAAAALDRAYEQGAVVICPVVYAELLAYPERGRDDVAALLSETEMRVDWLLPQHVWTDAGEAFAEYAQRRRDAGAGAPRRLLADFLIGAHARHLGQLITRDVGFYRTAFPDLRISCPA